METPASLQLERFMRLYRAIVAEKLIAPFVAGNNFFKDNHVVQDITEGTISVHKGKHVIMDTRAEMLMPVNPNRQEQQKPAYLQKIELKLTSLLPGQTHEQPVSMPDDQVVLVESWKDNEGDWPHAALCQVNNGKISLTNDTQEPIMLGKKGQIKTLKISKLEEHSDTIEQVPADYYKLNMSSITTDQGEENLKKINFGKNKLYMFTTQCNNFNHFSRQIILLSQFHIISRRQNLFGVDL